MYACGVQTSHNLQYEWTDFYASTRENAIFYATNHEKQHVQVVSNARHFHALE